MRAMISEWRSKWWCSRPSVAIAMASCLLIGSPEWARAAAPASGVLSFTLNQPSLPVLSKPAAIEPAVTDHARMLQPDPTVSVRLPLARSLINRSLMDRSSVALAPLFAGGTESLVARAVGHAEGTRHVTGKPTWAYWGHVDPGNRAWNQGTFSYQHAAASPQEADRKQLQRLKQQAQVLTQQAEAKGLQLSLMEQLNGIDLANQAPLAALDRGYIDWLAQARLRPFSETESVVWARTLSYWDPDRNEWNAPGLGNQYHSIQRDQQRRQQAIALVLAAHFPASSLPASNLVSSSLQPSNLPTSSRSPTSSIAFSIPD